MKEIDTLYPKQKNLLLMKEQQYQIHDYCSVVQTNTAQTLGGYGADFYQGQAAVTVNDYGEGSAYYLGDGRIKLFGRLLSRSNTTASLTK